ncbi:MAG: hypothetical protein D6798_05165 [Deltaproteobacteria bacterium]|nr:MAG: hypothetical protein D6798_05165 [Deltaproteobacteria bacterium]
MPVSAILLLGLLGFSARAEDLATGAPPRTPPERRPIEYSAWNLRPGEMRVGLTDLDVGVSRRLQLGTDPTLDAVGIYNLRTRISLADRDHWGLAVDSAGHSLQLGDFAARQLRVGLRASASAGWIAAHLGTTASWLSTGGTPDLTAADSLLGAALGTERLAEAQAALDRSNLDLDGQLGTVSARLAIELRIKGPHALVLQGGDALLRYSAVAPTLEDIAGVAPDDLGLDGVLDQTRGGAAWGSIAWQASWRNLGLRVGLGVSQLPLAWVAPTTEISWRTGGRRARRSLDAVVDAAPADVPGPSAGGASEWNDAGTHHETGGTGGTAMAAVAAASPRDALGQPEPATPVTVTGLPKPDEPTPPTTVQFLIIEYLGDDPADEAPDGEPAPAADSPAPSVEPAPMAVQIGVDEAWRNIHAEPPVVLARDH